MVGGGLSDADLSLFQLVEGLQYAFPRATARTLKKMPLVAGLRGRVAQHHRLSAYLASDRRIAFNEDGIFRHYPELDGQARSLNAKSAAHPVRVHSPQP